MFYIEPCVTLLLTNFLYGLDGLCTFVCISAAVLGSHVLVLVATK